MLMSPNNSRDHARENKRVASPNARLAAIQFALLLKPSSYLQATVLVSKRQAITSASTIISSIGNKN